MSTSSTEPTPASATPPPAVTGATPLGTTPPGTTPLGTTPADTASSSAGTLANVEETGNGPGFVARHTPTLIALMVAVIVAAVAIAGLVLYKNRADEANSKNEAAFTATVAQQGASLETIECDGDTCAAVINGHAYTVLVQQDAKGKQHFGVSAYAGD